MCVGSLFGNIETNYMDMFGHALVHLEYIDFGPLKFPKYKPSYVAFMHTQFSLHANKSFITMFNGGSIHYWFHMCLCWHMQFYWLGTNYYHKSFKHDLLFACYFSLTLFIESMHGNQAT